MSLPVTAVRTASFVVTMVLAGLAYPVLSGLVYVGFLVASATGDQGMGGPFAGLVIVLLGAAVGHSAWPSPGWSPACAFGPVLVPPKPEPI